MLEAKLAFNVIEVSSLVINLLHQRGGDKNTHVESLTDLDCCVLIRFLFTFNDQNSNCFIVG